MDFVPDVIPILGKPGAGKSTAAKAIDDPTFHYIATGDIGRRIWNDPADPYHALVKSCLDDGRLVPDEPMMEILHHEIALRAKQGSVTRHTVLSQDGAPRTLPQLEMINRFERVLGAVYVDVPDEIALARLQARKRLDDHDKYKERIQIFYNDTWPVVQEFKRRGMLYIVNGAPDLPEEESKLFVKAELYTALARTALRLLA